MLAAITPSPAKRSGAAELSSRVAPHGVRQGTASSTSARDSEAVKPLSDTRRGMYDHVFSDDLRDQFGFLCRVAVFQAVEKVEKVPASR